MQEDIITGQKGGMVQKGYLKRRDDAGGRYKRER